MQAATCEHSYRVFYGPCDKSHGILAKGRDFRIDESDLGAGIYRELPPLARDWVRIAMAVYVCDRLAKRDRRPTFASASRNIGLAVQVSEQDFWRSENVLSLLRESLRLLGDDYWQLSFSGPGGTWQRTFGEPPPVSPVVCLYSGGLDSAAGLANQLRDRADPTVAVTAWHQPRQRRRVLRHATMLRKRYGRNLASVVIRTSLRRAPRLSLQETTQRCRSFLFAALGGAVAAALGSSDVEVYENGIGALNVPLMRDMAVAGRATKSTHPQFLRLMGELATRVAGRRIEFRLPFQDWTKGEMVKSLVEDGLQPLAHDSVSCVHYPLRLPGTAKSCGTCPACIGRRQAMFAAGIDEDPRRYHYDLFGSPEAFGAIPENELDYLKATLLQVCYLAELDSGAMPSRLRDHLFGTRVVATELEAGSWLRLLRKYRAEWLDLISAAQKSRVGWAAWVGT